MGKHAKQWDGEQYLQDILQSTPGYSATGRHLGPIMFDREVALNMLGRMDIEGGEWVE